MHGRVFKAALVGASLAALVAPAGAADTIRLGVIMPMTGPGAADGKQIETAMKVFTQRHGTSVAGRTVEIIVKDDAGNPENAKRLAQSLIDEDKVQVLGVGLTPAAMAIAPIAAAAKVPQIVMISGTSAVTERSAYIVRTSFTLAQSSTTIADWARRTGSKRAITIASDWPPGIDAETSFKQRFVGNGGEVVESIRVPFSSSDFAAALTRAKEMNVDTAFVMVPSRHAGAFAKQYGAAGFAGSGVRLIGPGDLTDDDKLAEMGDTMLGVVTAHHYSAAHPSALNKEYVDAFAKTANRRPNFISVGGYDGLNVLYEALKKTNGASGGEDLVSAMKGLKWESPRGPIAIDAETRDIVQTIYLRKVERVAGELQNVEFAAVDAVPDPVKAAKK